MDKAELDRLGALLAESERTKGTGEIFNKIGKALASWAFVESALIQIFRRLTQLNDEMTAAILENFTGFGMLLDTCHAVVRSVLTDANEIKHWNTLVDYAREIYGDRNFLAHTPVALSIPKGTRINDNTTLTPQVGPALVSILSGQDRKAVFMNLREIDEVIEDIRYLAECIGAFDAAKASKKPLDAKFREPVVRRRPKRSERREAARQPNRSRPEPSPG